MNADWQVTCRQLYLGDELERWLAREFAVRPHRVWHFETQEIGDRAMWCFGLAGEARLVATVEASGLDLYDYDNDDDYSFASIDALVVWLISTRQSTKDSVPSEES